jgi:hypothetical protein
LAGFAFTGGLDDSVATDARIGLGVAGAAAGWVLVDATTNCAVTAGAATAGLDDSVATDAGIGLGIASASAG